MKMKSFELDRIQLLYEESLKNNKSLAHQNDTLALKMEVISNALFNLWIYLKKWLYDEKLSSQDFVTSLILIRKNFCQIWQKKKTISFPLGNLLDIVRLRALKNFGTQNLCPTTKTKNWLLWIDIRLNFFFIFLWHRH